MNLKELLKIDTTKTNWYKVFDKHGINPKTIDAVGSGGGGGDIHNRWYYMLDSNKLMTDFNFIDQNNIPTDVNAICMMIDFLSPSLTLIAREHGNDNYEYIKSASLLFNELSGWKLLRNPCFVISDEVPIVFDVIKGQALVVKGNLEERSKVFYEVMPDALELSYFLDYIIQLSKEEFESKIPKEIDYKDFINQ